jgi:hypothetical protein
MKLLIKFNLVLILVFGTGIGIAGYISRNFLERSAREEVLQQARLMMGAAGGLRTLYLRANWPSNAGASSPDQDISAANRSSLFGDRSI